MAPTRAACGGGVVELGIGVGDALPAEVVGAGVCVGPVAWDVVGEPAAGSVVVAVVAPDDAAEQPVTVQTSNAAASTPAGCGFIGPPIQKCPDTGWCRCWDARHQAGSGSTVQHRAAPPAPPPCGGGPMPGVMGRLGRFCAGRAPVVLSVWGLLVALALGILGVFGSDTNNDLSLPGTGSQAATDLLAAEFPPQQNGASPIVFHVDDGAITDDANAAAIQQSVAAILAIPEVYSAPDPTAQSELVSDDGSTGFSSVLLDVSTGDLTVDLAQQVLDATAPATDAGMQVAAGGPIGSELSTAESESSELVGILAAVVILTVTFGSLVSMGMPILMAIVGLILGLGILATISHVISIASTGPTLAVMIGLGVGIDYALFLVTKHRDNLRAGMTVPASIEAAAATSGSAIVFAGGTVIVALLSLAVAGIPLVTSLGYATAIAVLTAVAAAVTFLPAVLAVLGPRIDALRVPRWLRPSPKPAGAGMWDRWAHLVTEHRWLSVGVALGLLVPLIVPLFSLQLGQEDIGDTSPATTERQAFDLLSEHFGPGYNGPLLVAVSLAPAANPSYEVSTQYALATAMQTDLENKQQQFSDLQASLTAQQTQLEAEQAELEEQAADLQAEQNALLQHQAALEAAGSALQAQADDLEAQASALEDEETALRAAEADLAREAAALEATQVRLQEQAAELRREGEALARRARALAAEERQLLAELRDLEQQRVDLRREIAAIDEQIAQTTDPAVLAVLLEQRRELEAELEQVETEITDNRTRRAAVRAETRQLLVQARSLAEQAAQLQREAEAAQQEAAELRAQAADLRDVADGLRAQGLDLARQARALAEQEEDLEAQAAALRVEGDELQQQAADLQQQADELQAQGNELQQQGDYLQTEATETQAQQAQAEAIQTQLTSTITAVGGDSRGTDPRLVQVQNALAVPEQVVLVPPGRISDSGDAATFNAIPDSRPADPETADLVAEMRDDVLPGATGDGVTAYVGGNTAGNVDLAATITNKLPLVIGTVIALSFCLLMIAFRSLVVPAQAALTNLLSAAASFGVLTAWFQWGWGIGLVGLENPYGTVPIASYVPLMMFAALFGLSMDYEVFFVSQVQHHHAAGSNVRVAVRRGLAAAARVIVAAALIMIAVFGSFILTPDPVIKQFGVGLSVAVFLAALMVILLAPALLAIAGSRVFGLPRWLDRILPHVSIEGPPPAPVGAVTSPTAGTSHPPPESPVDHRPARRHRRGRTTHQPDS